MKYLFTFELNLKEDEILNEDEIIGAKEQIAAAFENIGAVRITSVEVE